MAAKRLDAPIKVGLLTVLSIVILVLSLVWLRGRGLSGGEVYTVRFSDVDGLREGAPVQMMGIRVGFVEQIKPIVVRSKYYVNVDFQLTDADIQVPRGSILAIEQSGIIGEKFLEITPPKLQSVILTTFNTAASQIKPGIPVKMRFEEGLLEVGHVERVEQVPDESMVFNKLFFRITHPGAAMPANPVYELALDPNQHYYLRVLSHNPQLPHQPDKDAIFTVENPLRIKEFLQIQLDSAEALKVTNEKIVQLFSDDTISTLNNTIKNTEVLTARATEVLDTADALFKTSSRDLEKLVHSSDALVTQLNGLSNNLNAIVGDPKLQSDIKATVASVKESTDTLNTLLQDPKLKDTFNQVNSTAVEANLLLKTANSLTQDQKLRAEVGDTVNNLNVSLEQLSRVLGQVETVSQSKDASLGDTLGRLAQYLGELKDI
jgi:phospholipid/cholesterol/gamma-HCH transport system substrate-binding protein